MTEKNKFVVYTAIYGGYIKLIDAIPSENCDFVCFTDNPHLKSNTWEIRYIKGLTESPRRNARIYKILPHIYFKEYDYSLWVDATHIPLNAANFVNEYLSKSDIALFKHHRRNCIYKELDACTKLKKDDINIMHNQIKKYKQNGYPANNGLASSGVIARKHNKPHIIKAMEDWWEEIKNNSVRDQLSFNYIMHKNNLKYYEINKNIFHNSYFKTSMYKRRTLNGEEGIKAQHIINHIKTITPIICPSRKFIYMKITKTAGTSIYRKTIEPNIKDAYCQKTYKHQLNKCFDEITAEELNNYYKFTFVRNTWDRTISNFFYAKKCKFIEQNKTFDEFLDILEEPINNGEFKAHVLPQHLFFMFQGKQYVDFIGRFENLDNDWSIVANKISLPIKKLPVSQTTRHEDYRTYYNDERIRRVYKIYKEEVDFLKYNFDPS